MGNSNEGNRVNNDLLNKHCSDKRFHCYMLQNFHGFQAVCVVVAVMSWLLMRYSATHVQVAVEATISDKPHAGNTLEYISCCICYTILKLTSNHCIQ